MSVGGTTVRRPGRARGPVADRALELVLAGLARDEEELLGDLAEGRSEVADAAGERAARRWWRRQAVLALPRLAWDGLAHSPSTWLLGLGGFVGWALLAAMVPAPFGTDAVAYDAVHPLLPSVHHIVVDTVVVGVGSLIAAAVAGAGTAALAHRARLLPALVAAACMMLIASRHGFHVVLGPGTCQSADDGLTHTCSVELGPASRDALVPALWQVPTMMVLLPTVTAAGASAVVARYRRRERPVEAAAARP